MYEFQNNCMQFKIWCQKFVRITVYIIFSYTNAFETNVFYGKFCFGRQKTVCVENVLVFDVSAQPSQNSQVPALMSMNVYFNSDE